MKYENFSQAKDVVEKITSHKNMVDKLMENPYIFIMPFDYFDPNQTILKINPTIERGPELWSKELIDKLIADYEDRISTLTIVLDNL